MVLSKITEFTGIRRRVLTAYLLGVLVSSVVLSWVYVSFGGPDAVGTPGFQVVNRMLYATSILLVGGVGSGVYWLFKNDFSTALAPLIGAAFGLFSGFQDIIVYLLCVPKTSGACGDINHFPETWPWLQKLPPGQMAELLGFNSLTNTALVAAVAAWFVISLIVLRLLQDFETTLLGVNL